MLLDIVEAENERSAGWKRVGRPLTWGGEMGIDQQRCAVIGGAETIDGGA